MYGQIPPHSLYDSVFGNNSWGTIAACSEAGIAGDIWTTDGVCTKDIVLNTNEILTLEIMGFDHDPLADGSGYAGITIGMKHLMEETRQLDGYNDTNRNFVDLSIYSWLNSDFYNSLPDDLKPYIKEVDKLTGEADGSFNVRTDKMKVFLFSEQEVSGDQSYSVGNEGKQYARFTDTTSRIKLLVNGTDLPYYWWLRSPTYTVDGFCYVYHNGGIGETSPTAYYGVCAGFCI